MAKNCREKTLEGSKQKVIKKYWKRRNNEEKAPKQNSGTKSYEQKKSSSKNFGRKKSVGKISRKEKREKKMSPGEIRRSLPRSDPLVVAPSLKLT